MYINIEPTERALMINFKLLHSILQPFKELNGSGVTCDLQFDFCGESDSIWNIQWSFLLFPECQALIT